jgi:acyl carrier protein
MNEPAKDYRAITLRILSESTGHSEDEIAECEDLPAMGLDSLDIVETTMAFEAEFDLDIKDEDAECVRTVADIVAYLERREA